MVCLPREQLQTTSPAPGQYIHALFVKLTLKTAELQLTLLYPFLITPPPPSCLQACRREEDRRKESAGGCGERPHCEGMASPQAR